MHLLTVIVKYAGFSVDLLCIKYRKERSKVERRRMKSKRIMKQNKAKLFAAVEKRQSGK